MVMIRWRDGYTSSAAHLYKLDQYLSKQLHSSNVE